MTPIPPASAMAIASLASVTVSIAAEMIGRLRRIARVSCVPIFVALGITALRPGRSKTSSNARPSGIELGSISAIAMPLCGLSGRTAQDSHPLHGAAA